MLQNVTLLSICDIIHMATILEFFFEEFKLCQVVLSGKIFHNRQERITSIFAPVRYVRISKLHSTIARVTLKARGENTLFKRLSLKDPNHPSMTINQSINQSTN